MFRTDKKELFLTYAQCDLPLETILAHCRAALHSKGRRVVNYVISSEEHKDGGLHRHAYLLMDSKISNEFEVRLFDINGFHPNFEGVRRAENVIGYVAKDGQYITDYPDHFIKKQVDKWRENQEKKKKFKEKDKDGKRGMIWKELLEGTLTIKDLAKKYPCQGFYLKNWKQSWDLYCKINRPEPPKLDELDNYWLWGPPGVGKTEWVYKRFGENIFDKPADKWWSGYKDQENVVINDIGEDHRQVIYMLKTWSENRPFNGQVKGDDPIYIRPRRLCVTSNYTISQLLELLGIQDSMLLGSLKRRFKEVRIYPGDDALSDKCAEEADATAWKEIDECLISYQKDNDNLFEEF